jgi:hypothetical protein
MQLDIFVPKYSLGFEYQGQQHYFDVYPLPHNRVYVDRDQQKRIACKNAGVTLVEVPFWWDFELESLRATVHQIRPDLISSPGLGVPIPSSIPTTMKGAAFHIDIYSLKALCYLLLWNGTSKRI